MCEARRHWGIRGSSCTVGAPANTIVVRLQLPDSTDVGGINLTLSLYHRESLSKSFCSAHIPLRWHYGKYPFTNLTEKSGQAEGFLQRSPLESCICQR